MEKNKELRVFAEEIRDLRSDPENRIQRNRRLLKYIRNLPSADLPERTRCQIQHIFRHSIPARQQHLSPRNPRRRRREKTRQRHARNTLPASALPHQRQNLPLPKMKRHIRNRRQPSPFRLKLYRQILYIQYLHLRSLLHECEPYLRILSFASQSSAFRNTVFPEQLLFFPFFFRISYATAIPARSRIVSAA